MTPIRWAIVAVSVILSLLAAWFFLSPDNTHYIYDLHGWATGRPR